MRISTMGAPEIIRWGRRLIYVLMFIILMMAFGNYDKPWTFAYIGAFMCLMIPVLLFLNDEEWQEEGYTYIKAINSID